MKILFLGALFLSIPCYALAWEGYDYDKNSYVEINKGNLVREGSEIEIYDYGSNSYKNVEVQDVRSYGRSTTLEVYDSETGENRTLEMNR